MSEIQEKIQAARAAHREHIQKSFTNSAEILKGGDPESEEEVKTDDPSSEEETTEKGEVSNIFYSDNIKFKRTGKEIRKQVEDVIIPELKARLASLQVKADALLEQTGKGPTSEPDSYWTDGFKINIGYKVYRWRETYIPTPEEGGVAVSFSAQDAEEKRGNCPQSPEEAKARNDYNDTIREMASVKLDIAMCNILSTLDENKEYELTPRQIAVLRFANEGGKE